MTVEEHNLLYEEIKKVIYSRGRNTAELTDAQLIFVEALEQANFGSDFLKVYAELVDNKPEISLRNLHAFCLGFGLGLSVVLPEINLTKSYH